MTEEWTPYGLEAIRARILWRRRIMAIVLAVVVALAILLLFAALSKKTYETEISLAGGSGDNTIEVETKDADELRSKPLTIAVSPGGITLVGNGLTDGEGAADRLSRASVNYPFIRGETPFNFLSLMFPWGLLILLAWAIWSAGRGEHNASAEVNFGIYKGTAPLEIVTASYRHLVVTQRLAHAPIFGKEREDYLPEDEA